MLSRLTARRSARLGALAIALALVATLVTAFASDDSAEAAVGSNFDPGFIISDETMYESGSMTAAEIDAFLDLKGASCRAAGSLPCLKDVAITHPVSPTRTSSDGTKLYCTAIPAGSARSAGQVIASVSAACRINPQVLLVLIEKEQSLVTRTSPTEYSYKFATGYACPDTSGCSDAKAGLFVQLVSAARQFQAYAAYPNEWKHIPGQYNDVLYHPNAACGSSRVFIQNQATASLYNYTPYQPNAAALANMYGTGDGCSSYGNRNFWRIFSDWFGSPGNLIGNGSFESGAVSWAVTGTVDRQAVNSATAAAGSKVLRANARAAGASFHQTTARTVKIGNSFEGSLSVRTVSATGSAKVKLVVWALGGTAESAVTTATVGSTWSELTANVLVKKAGHSAVRVELFIDTPGVLLELDDGRLFQTETQSLTGVVGMSSPSFENGFGRWTPGNGFINRVIYTNPDKAVDGSSLLGTNTTVKGRSMSQTITRNVSVSSSYTATLWVRSANGKPFTGNVALWALGASSQSRSTSFTVTDTWTPIAVTLPVTKAGNNRLKLEIYLNTTGATLYVDNVTVTTNLLANPSLESGVPPWAITGTGTNLVTYGRATYMGVDGSFVGATNVKTSGSSILIDEQRMVRRGESFTASIWVRAASAAKPADVTFALWALGGATPLNATTTATLGGEWTQLTVKLPVDTVGVGTLRLELYQSTVSSTILFDGARLY